MNRGIDQTETNMWGRLTIQTDRDKNMGKDTDMWEVKLDRQTGTGTEAETDMCGVEDRGQLALTSMS